MSIVDYDTMLVKLEEMYIREKTLNAQIRALSLELEQVRDDIDLLQNMIMHQSNKKSRIEEILKKKE